jgi:hypothetical protein
MKHFGGSKTHECKECGSRLIENHQCLTCDSYNLKELTVGIFINFDTPADAELKHDLVFPVLDKFYKQTQLEGDVIHIIPVKDIDKVTTLIDGYNVTHDAALDFELIKINN